MKPLIKLFGYGVYRVDDVERLKYHDEWMEGNWYEAIDIYKSYTIRFQYVIKYLSTLKGRRASKKKVMKLLKG